MDIEKKELKSKWYFKRGAVIFLILSIGPLAFYNLWGSKEFSKRAKIIWTVAVLALTIIIVVGAQATYRKVLDDLQKQMGVF